MSAPRGCSSLCHHVLLTLVESDLAERDGAHRHVDGGGDEAVDADLVVQTVDVLRRIFIVTDVLLSERDVLDQHGRLRTEEDSQHGLLNVDSFSDQIVSDPHSAAAAISIQSAQPPALRTPDSPDCPSDQSTSCCCCYTPARCDTRRWEV